MKIRISDPERFAKIASGVQSIALTLAILAGGFWTLYVFNIQLQVENAQAQLAKLKRELLEQANIEVKLTAQPLNTSDRKSRYINGTITVKNYGNRIAVLSVRDDSLRVGRVSVLDGGKLAFTEATNVRLYIEPNDKPLVSLTAFPGAETRVAFVASVRDPGIYLVSFSVNTSKEEETRLRTAGESLGGQAVWGDVIFIYAE